MTFGEDEVQDQILEAMRRRKMRGNASYFPLTRSRPARKMPPWSASAARQGSTSPCSSIYIP